MPSQIIQLQAAWYFPSHSRWKPPQGSRPAIDAGLRGADPRFLETLVLADAEIRLRIASSQTEISTSGQDLTSTFEQNGSLELIVGSNSLLVALAGADTTDPYVWTPANGAEVAAFEALLSSTSGTESGQLIIRDFVPVYYVVNAGDVAWDFDLPQPTVTYTPPATVAHSVDAGDVSWSFDITEPTVTYTPPAPTSTLATSDWNSAGYQAPIVLALLPATISGSDITVDPVTAIAGNLFVATGMTIDGVESYPDQDSIRLRRTGDGRFDSYFDNEASPLYPDAKLFIVIDNLARTHIPFTIGATGGGFNNWNYDTASQESLIEDIATGDRFLLAIAEPLAAAHVVDAGDVAWVFDLPEPTVTYTPAGSQAVNAGDVSWSFDITEPTVTYTPAGAQAVNAGDVSWTFHLPQPTVTYTPPAGPVDHVVNAGDVEWAFHIQQPTVTAGGVRPYTSLVQSAFAHATDEVWLILLTISHADLTNDIQVVHNPVAITSRGMSFVGFAFDLSLPIDSPDRAPVAELRIDNVSQEIAQAVRSISSAPTVKIEVVRAADPDVVELSLDGFRLRNVNWDADSVRGALVLDDIATEPYPAGIFSPAGFPGLT